jgi:hypothetical protein
MLLPKGKKGDVMGLIVAKASKADISSMVELSYLKRKNYEQAQPQFWKYAEGAEKIQTEWFEELLEHKDYILLVAKENSKIIGFIIGRLVIAPEVYNPGGLTLMIDDFACEDWINVGKLLMEKIAKIAKEKGAVQFCVVAGNHDLDKCRFLEEFGLNCASRWYVGSI